jgi:hypothetical protein
MSWYASSSRWELIDDIGAILAEGTAISRIQALRLAWEACEEMGLVTDE